jgi:hypothetical protein
LTSGESGSSAVVGRGAERDNGAKAKCPRRIREILLGLPKGVIRGDSYRRKGKRNG